MLFKKKCYFCARKSRNVTIYFNRKTKVFVCDLCKEYAERRAYKRG